MMISTFPTNYMLVICTSLYLYSLSNSWAKDQTGIGNRGTRQKRGWYK